MNKQIMHELLTLATASMPLKTIEVNGEEYLRRYFFKHLDDGSQLWLHHFIRNDSERHLHSHPGSATSKILCGAYAEQTELGVRCYSTGDTNEITADKLHRIIRVDPDTWTLMHVQPDWLNAESWYFLDDDGVKTEVRREPGADWWVDLPCRDAPALVEGCSE